MRRALIPATVVLACLVSGSGTAHAVDAAQARQEAQAAKARVGLLTSELTLALQRYDATVAAVGGRVVDAVLAEVDADDARDRVSAARSERVRAARALYMSGGRLGVLATVLESGDPADLALRVVSVRRVLDSRAVVVADGGEQVAGYDVRAAQASRAADASVVTAEQVRQRAAEVQRLLDEAEVTLTRLSARAQALQAAEEARRALERARAAAAAAQRHSTGAVTAQGIPAEFAALYKAAATSCPGMHWTLLAAVGQVETGHGRNNGPSSAGAIGPMQFMPRTFQAYGVDGDRDGVRDPWSPADAIWSAASYLCSSGAGSPATLNRALLRYNNAQWYADLVLGVQARLLAATSTSVPAPAARPVAAAG